MRIACPCCGERDRQEFTVLGDAEPVRPDGLHAESDAMFEYVYLRNNVAGPHREYWHHSAGCHTWLIVTRDTRTHAVLDVQCARDVALARLSTGVGR